MLAIDALMQKRCIDKATALCYFQSQTSGGHDFMLEKFGLSLDILVFNTRMSRWLL